MEDTTTGFPGITGHHHTPPRSGRSSLTSRGLDHEAVEATVVHHVPEVEDADAACGPPSPMSRPSISQKVAPMPAYFLDWVPQLARKIEALQLENGNLRRDLETLREESQKELATLQSAHAESLDVPERLLAEVQDLVHAHRGEFVQVLEAMHKAELKVNALVAKDQSGAVDAAVARVTADSKYLQEQMVDVQQRQQVQSQALEDIGKLWESSGRSQQDALKDVQAEQNEKICKVWASIGSLQQERMEALDTAFEGVQRNERRVESLERDMKELPAKINELFMKTMRDYKPGSPSPSEKWEEPPSRSSQQQQQHRLQPKAKSLQRTAVTSSSSTAHFRHRSHSPRRSSGHTMDIDDKVDDLSIEVPPPNTSQKRSSREQGSSKGNSIGFGTAPVPKSSPRPETPKSFTPPALLLTSPGGAGAHRPAFFPGAVMTTTCPPPSAKMAQAGVRSRGQMSPMVPRMHPVWLPRSRPGTLELSQTQSPSGP